MEREEAAAPMAAGFAERKDEGALQRASWLVAKQSFDVCLQTLMGFKETLVLSVEATVQLQTLVTGGFCRSISAGQGRDTGTTSPTRWGREGGVQPQHPAGWESSATDLANSHFIALVSFFPFSFTKSTPVLV